jgi:hypothetical protein
MTDFKYRLVHILISVIYFEKDPLNPFYIGRSNNLARFQFRDQTVTSIR